MPKINLPNTIKNIVMCGDLHGNLELIKYYINSNKFQNTVIFICGDIGLGFQPKWEYKILEFINKKLIETNNYVIAIYGNHDNNSMFTDTELIDINGNPKNWLNVPNYTVVNVCDKNFLLIGGGISIDRTWRISSNIGYWENESPIYKNKVNNKIDVIVSHSSPSCAYPHVLSSFVLNWAERDPNLLQDIKNERETLDKVYNDYKDTITHWYYGHYHTSISESIDNILFRCCDIGELVYHYE